MGFINTDERHYTGNTLNKWFAISSVLFFGAIILTFWDDNDDDFKVYQKEFRKMEAKKAEEKYSTAYSGISDKMVEYENKLNLAKQQFNDKALELEEANKLYDKLDGRYYQANMAYLDFKGEVDVLKYKLEDEEYKDSYKDNDNENNSFVVKYENAKAKLIKLRLKREEAEKKLNTAEANIDFLKQDLTQAQKDYNSLTSDVDLLKSNLEKLSFDHMNFANKVANIVRDLPIIDFLDPYYKVKQTVVDEVKDRMPFAEVESVDRCMSCHLGIDKKGYEDAPQPYTTHPNLDLFLTSSSPHPNERFGCTSCHAGRGRGTGFTSSVHMPNSKEDKERWEDEHDWHQMHHWLKPMLPTRYSEAGCFKCHSSEANIQGADKLTYGLTLIEQGGCYGCHNIEKYEGKDRNGPNLKRINEKVDKKWTRKWAWDPKGFRHNTWMPAFFMQTNNSDSLSIRRNKAEVYSIVEYLFRDKTEISKEKDYSEYMGDSENGEKLYGQLGCQGCHVIEPEPFVEENNSYNLLNKHGSNLIGLGSKTTPEWLFNWLKNPAEYWPDTKMPNMRLSDEEAKDITAYLMSMKNDKFDNFNDIELDKDEIHTIAERWLKKSFTFETVEQKLNEMSFDEKVDYVAKKSINYYGCAGCHVIDGFEDAKPIGADLTYHGSKNVNKFDFGFIKDIEHTNYGWFEAKLKNPRIFDKHKEVEYEDKSRMPNYNFNDEQVEAIVTALMGFTDDALEETILADVSPNAVLINEGMNIVKENNCQGCHIVNNYGGRILEDIGKPEYGPPNLNTQGAKTQPEWLYDFFLNPYTIRPHLKVRMPSYNLDESEWNSIISGFRAMENEVNNFEVDHVVNREAVKYHAGQKLAEIGQCQSCHFIGTDFPTGDPPTWAPNLAMTKNRLRPSWVVDWLKNPQAIMPGTKMPAVYIPTEDILSMEGAEKDWGDAVIKLSGQENEMLEGVRDWIYSLEGKEDISYEVKQYFLENGYGHLEESEDEEDEEGDEWDDEDDWDDEDY